MTVAWTSKNRPPIGVWVIAILLLLTGAVSVVGDIMNFKSLSADHYEIVWIALVHLLAIVAGGFLLRGSNWARWLAIAWMAFHVAISVGHPLQQLVMHAAFLVLFVWLLFRRDARNYFGPPTASA